jgi:hypothetical protein
MYASSCNGATSRLLEAIDMRQEVSEHDLNLLGIPFP